MTFNHRLKKEYLAHWMEVVKTKGIFDAMIEWLTFGQPGLYLMPKNRTWSSPDPQIQFILKPGARFIKLPAKHPELTEASAFNTEINSIYQQFLYANGLRESGGKNDVLHQMNERLGGKYFESLLSGNRQVTEINSRHLDHPVYLSHSIFDMRFLELGFKQHPGEASQPYIAGFVYEREHALIYVLFNPKAVERIKGSGF